MKWGPGMGMGRGAGRGTGTGTGTGTCSVSPGNPPRDARTDVIQPADMGRSCTTFANATL